MTAHADMTAAGTRVLDLLTVPEAAARIGRSQREVRRLADEGVLVRITPESVAAYLEAV